MIIIIDEFRILQLQWRVRIGAGRGACVAVVAVGIVIARVGHRLFKSIFVVGPPPPSKFSGFHWGRHRS